ncbi:MAG: TetR/AcrR family transcriptional regulator [Mycobacterium kyogaense]|uniref:TetR/AcrR family transcriptional regulator n=1 Tax=Mycobacterium kyogaense TaxID=2212479 RepID=UPI002FFBC9B7
MSKPWQSRRAAPTVRKGDLREQQILDSAEHLLSTVGYAAMTVGDIAQAAGLTRAALYFYFGSKHDVLAALVARTAQVLTEEAGLARTDSRSVDEVIAGAVERTAALWLAHGPVMRMAVDLGTTVPDIGQMWSAAAEESIDVIAQVLQRCGVPSHDGPEGAAALARALCWMIERNFYQASKISAEAIGDTSQTCQTIWRAVADGTAR